MSMWFKIIAIAILTIALSLGVGEIGGHFFGNGPTMQCVYFFTGMIIGVAGAFWALWVYQEESDW